MTDSQSLSDNNKRIAKNTAYLYIRMAVVMLVSLYTSRKVLEILGVSDYGIYDVMGGVIGMLGYANTLIAGGISRFLTIALGEGDLAGLKKLFSTTLFMSILSAFLIFILGETIGLWFVNTQLNIPYGREGAAIWVYQCALVSSCLTIIQSPYTASVISHEKMSIYAYMSILDSSVKLLIVYLLIISGYDKLKTYGFLLFMANLLNVIIYRQYCVKKFDECTSRIGFSKDIFKRILGYNSWNMIGGFAGILTNYGVNIIINIFFGTTVNAARGIATQVSTIVRSLYGNFQMAANPQIYKYYAQQNFQEMFKLVINTSKYCTYLLLCIVIPVCINASGILNIWLHEVPPFSTVFVQLSMIYILVCSIDAPIGISIHAVGRMKVPNLSTALVNLCVFPMTWLAFKLGGQPQYGYVFMIFSMIVCLMIDLYIVKSYIDFPVTTFLKKCLLPITIISISCTLISYIIKECVPEIPIWGVLLSSSLSVVFIFIFIFFFGLSQDVRKMIMSKVKCVL